MSKGKIFFASILAVLAWWCANKVTWQVRTDQEAGRDFSQIIDRFTLDLTAHPLHISFAGADVLGGFGGIALVLLIALYMYGARKPTRPVKNKAQLAGLNLVKLESLLVIGKLTCFSLVPNH